jgi:hypothetical protein
MDDNPPPQPTAPFARSQASGNWRTKDTMPRAEPQSQYRSNQRSFNQNRSHQDGTGGGGAPDSNVPETRLYVGNLLYTAQRNEVEAFFTDHGFNITGISMSIDPFTNRNKSYAFVDFESVDEAQRAIAELNGQELLGRAVRINPGMRKEGGGGGGAGGPGGVGGGGYQSRERGYEQRQGGGPRGGAFGGQDYGMQSPLLPPFFLTQFVTCTHNLV